MSNKEELSRLSFDELKELGVLIHKASRILNDDRKKLSELSFEGRDIALTLELLSSTITFAEMSFLSFH